MLFLENQYKASNGRARNRFINPLDRMDKKPNLLELGARRYRLHGRGITIEECITNAMTKDQIQTIFQTVVIDEAVGTTTGVFSR